MSDAKLLPICDIVFVFASLLIFFCDVLFSCLSAFALVLQDYVVWPIVFCVFIFVSSVLCQGFSFKWHVKSRRDRSHRNPTMDDEPMWVTHTVVFIHCLQVSGRSLSSKSKSQTSSQPMRAFSSAFRSRRFAEIPSLRKFCIALCGAV